MNDHDETVLGNIAVIRGSVRAEPTIRELPGGGVVAQFDVVATSESGGRQLTVSVPIAWNDPTTSQLGVLAGGSSVLVVGTVRRRFFRVGGVTQSRTEVVADAVVPMRQHKRVGTALRAAADRVLDLAA
ncbi:MAG TPA: single-stranded DNA-binding protein [Ilumatobacteraceae bacterium]|jgi:single-strand DNA-binding protein|nr:single-stranded DNA-binding protein [Ilumatobacteraceae bacterium]